jgi:hypothetical protein
MNNTANSETRLVWVDYLNESFAPGYQVVKRRARYRAYKDIGHHANLDRIDRISHLTREDAKKACEWHAQAQRRETMILEYPSERKGDRIPINEITHQGQPVKYTLHDGFPCIVLP